MAQRIATYEEFWPYYLREHADPLTRRVHVLGTLLGIGLFLAGLVTMRWWLMPAGIVSGYLFAWVSHMTIERNRPATFSHPLWSLGSDLRMAWLFLTGRLEEELRRAGVDPTARR
ncbi:Mpo1-like protein [Muricoccus radiodurans]|uniref:Mpo1-like protein n=1 Tax=Muricoccus radiodurans TaxID=2231721 RepID=UPI003CEA11EA